MEQVRRVVVRDQSPLFSPDIIRQPLNRILLAGAGGAVLLQGVALWQVATGRGNTLAWFDHADFALVSLLWLSLGVLVFFQRRALRAGQAFLLFAIAGSTALSYGSLYSVSVPDALIFAGGLLLFPACLLSFTRAFDGRRRGRSAELLWYIPPLALIVPGVQSLAGNVTTLLWKLGLVSIGVYLGACAVQAWYDLRQAISAEQAAQSRALVFGLIAGTIPGVAAFVVPTILTGSVIVVLTWLPPIILLFLVAMSYAVLLFEFSEAELIVRRGIVYGALTLIILVVYGALGAVLAAGHLSVVHPGGGLSFVAVTIAIGAAFSPIRRNLRRLVDLVLYGQSADRWEVLQALSTRLGVVMAPDELADVLARELVAALRLNGAFVLRHGPHGLFEARHRVVSASAHARYHLPDPFVLDDVTLAAALGEPAAPLLLVHAKPLTAGRRAPTPPALWPLDRVRASLSIPLVTRSGLEAVVCLQAKEAHDAFASDDLELLGPVIRQASAALDNALLFERLETTLQEVRLAYERIAREQETERARLARELHDGTAQELAGLITLATVAERQLQRADNTVGSTLATLRRRAEEAYQGVRRSSHALRPQMLDDFGLVPALEDFVRGYQDSTHIAVYFDPPTLGRLPPDIELALFRVVQECLENVRKHSGARTARLHLARGNGLVSLEVTDDGRGLASSEGNGIGMAGMRDRVAAVGGKFMVSAGSRGGVRVRAVIPVEVGQE